MQVCQLTHLYDRQVMVHLDYDDPPEGLWIIRRYARFYRGYTCVELKSCRTVVDEAIRQEALSYPENYRLLSGWVEGRLISWDKEQSVEGLYELCYHPWERGDFFLAHNTHTVTTCDYIYFHSDGKAYARL